MAAYGTVARPGGPTQLPVRTVFLKGTLSLSLFHVPAEAADSLDAGLLQALTDAFNAVVEEGRTYPYEIEVDTEGFKASFLSHDLIIGLLEDNADLASSCESAGRSGVLREGLAIDEVRRGRDWSDVVGGYFYVKPNYAARSAHNCNAGFIVPSARRGLRLGATLGGYYTHVGPRLGYRASVFNLVYVSNVASCRIWDALGFTRVGIIPEAGRLKRLSATAGDSSTDTGEEYVDAYVYYLRFDEV